MSRSTRFLMGIAIVSILAPAMALVIPDQGDDRSPAMAQAMTASDRDSMLLPAASPEDPHASNPTISTAENTPSSAETSSSEDDVQATNVNDQSDHSDHSNRPDDEAKTEPGESSTTAVTKRPDTTTTSAASVESGSVLTGTVCPCTIAGTVELKGEVSLQGDLIVDRGTLVARPGVNLNGNGFQIMFMNGGRADFQGSKVFTWSDRGAKQNLQRDINFRNLRRIMWMANGGPSLLKYFTVSNSGTSAVGDYPLHWHLNGNSTRGTLVEGVVVINGRHHAYVPHGSHGITLKDVIAKNTRGDAFWWDHPGTNESCSFQKFCTLDNSNDIKVDHALVDGVTNGPGDNRGFRLTGFMLGAGSGNAIHNTTAINISPSHVKDCSGFHWPESANQNIGGNVWSFVNNHSHSPSGCHGIFVWQNDGNSHVVNGFTGGGIDHGAYGNQYQYANIDVPYVEIHAAGWSARDGRVNTVVASKHVSDHKPTATFTSVAIVRFVVRNADDNGSVPGEYVLNGTGLTCEDVEYANVVPGTKVVIDGVTCP